MIAIHLDHVTFSYASEPLFIDLMWAVHDDRIVGLVGPNGSGKSTLLKLVLGELEADGGCIVRKKGLTIGYLPQMPEFDETRTAWTEVFSGSGELGRIDGELQQIETDLSDPRVYANPVVLQRTMSRQEKLLAEFERLGGVGLEGRVRSLLRDLGFDETQMRLPLSALSGGQKKLVGLARLLISRPALLLLDEPDNHLDLEGKALLERVLRNYEGGVLLVSHDRYLLDLLVDEIAELEDGRLQTFKGNYSEYVFEKQLHLLRQQQLFQAQQKEITRLEQAAKRLLLWGKVFDNEKFSKRGANILKRLERVERIERPVLDRPRMQLSLGGWEGSRKVLEVRNLDKVFPAGNDDAETILFVGLDLRIEHGERVGLVGPNGAGKSVLMRALLGLEPVNGGEVILGPSVRTAYYAQQHETLDPACSLLETVQKAGNLPVENAVAFLKRFLFPYRMVQNRVGTLSGGERSRLQMALIMLAGANFLLLDEPTNHLDIASAEVLEDALQDFEGSVLVISHDRYFLDRVVQRTVELDDGILRQYLGGYSDYRAARLA